MSEEETKTVEEEKQPEMALEEEKPVNPQEEVPSAVPEAAADQAPASVVSSNVGADIAKCSCAMKSRKLRRARECSTSSFSTGATVGAARM